jgi:protein SCO1/2
VTAALVALALLLAGCGSSTSSHPSTNGTTPGGTAGPGTTVAIRVPPSLLRLPLTNQHGQRVSLASFGGKTVLLVPFLSLCQDVCPLTTGNLLQVQQALAQDSVSSKVEIVELSVDPERDNPQRLFAYARLTGANWVLVTEPASELRALAKFFGFTYQTVPEEKPAGIDWLTGEPLTYDVDHSDNYFVIDPSGVERVVQDAAPDFRGVLNPKLYAFLSELGRQHLAQPAQPDWTPVDVLKALSVAVGERLPLTPIS